MKPRRWFVSQIGAREHYAAPRALHRRGSLGLLYTDLWPRFGRGLLSHGPAPARAFAARFHAELPPDKVVGFTLSYGLHRLAARLRARPHPSEFDTFIDIGRWFAQHVEKHLRTRVLAPGDAFFGFNTGMLETIPLLRERGVLSVVDQIDPGQVERDMVFEESQRWPGWAHVPGEPPQAYCQRISEEWRQASVVVVNSPWSRTALIQQGVPPTKIVVIPLAFEPHGPLQTRPPADFQGPLHVLWIGSVILRKGIQYLFAAARELAGTNIRFTVAGRVGISDTAMASAPPNITFVGRITRDQTRALYRSGHVFVLPTISDGFAITQLEAMAEGLPVIATPNCGEVVTHGDDGLIVPVRDSAALANAFVQLDQDRPRLAAMSQQAQQKVQQFSLAHYADLLEQSVAPPAPSP